MLTSDQSILSFERGVAVPDRLTRKTHAHYVVYAERMMDAYREGIGLTRRELHQRIGRIFAGEADCEARRISAFCKLLDESATFDTDRRGRAAELRMKVFSRAAQFHPLVIQADHMFERTEAEVKQLIAVELGEPWEQIERALYADVIDCQPMVAFAGYASPAALLSRYNVAQLQASLYRSDRMRVTIRSDFAAVVRYAKLARLLMEISRTGPDEYRLDLSGPASVLHETRRYGINFARFLPALLSCGDWSMSASLRTPWGTKAMLEITNASGYTSDRPAPDEFDSSIEEGFARKWGESQEGWRLLRDAGILHEEQYTFVPDFLLRHEDGREVFLEIVGFWTPQYLSAKRKTLSRFRDRRILIALPQRTVKEEVSSPEVIVYKTVLKMEAVLEKLRQPAASA